MRETCAESVVKYGLSSRKISMNVMNSYKIEKSPIHEMTGIEMLWLTFGRNMIRPAKNSKTARCIKAGNPSTTKGRFISFAPRENKARILARFSGLHRAG